MKRILFYCQHLLGMGHFMRSAALVNGLANEFQVCFLNGGEIIPGFSFDAGEASNIEVINLAAIRSDESFSTIGSANGDDLAMVQMQRRNHILSTFERFRPDIVVIELYPFGRKKFSFELLPLLARIRLSARKTQVVCSLRDILVSRPGQERYEAQACTILNRYFDLLLVHADPHFQRLDETFHSVDKIAIPISYTGYVAQSDTEVSNEGMTQEDVVEEEIVLDPKLPLFLASIGGGRVGVELLRATIEASELLYTAWPHQLLIFTGPYLPDENFAELKERSAGMRQIQVRRFTTQFLSYMARASLSISMAGYNTCVNILTTGVRALVLPFTGGDNNEQSLRASKLAAQGIVTALQPEDLASDRLQHKIMQALQSQPAPASLTLDGVVQSSARLRELAAKTRETRAPQEKGFQDHTSAESFTHLPAKMLRPHLESYENSGRELHFFLRDDDVDIEEESLRHLLDIGLSHAVPISLAVIPAHLTPEGARYLKNVIKLTPGAIEIHQHGWQHVNHEVQGRKCEFGSSRSYEEQYSDIRCGKTRLEESFGERFFWAFTPPWNRCTPSTMAVLNDLDFKVLSRDSSAHDGTLDNGEEAPVSHGFEEISISVDILAKGSTNLRETTEILETVIRQMQKNAPIGIMLHHKVMDAETFAFLDLLLTELCRYPCVHFHTLQELYHLAQAQDRVSGGVKIA